MSRRDTIILAVLINSALLIVLFATAISHGGDKPKTFSDMPTPSSTISKQESPISEYTPLKPIENSSAVLTTPETVIAKEPNYLQPAPISNKPVQESSSRQVKTELPKAIPPKPSYVEVTVKKGDYLDKIARANNVTVKDIMQANQMNSTRLHIGQVLKIPLKDTETATQTVQPNSKKISYYTVQSGDTLWNIANKHHMQMRDLLRINGLDEDSAKRLQPGDSLKIEQ